MVLSLSFSADVVVLLGVFVIEYSMIVGQYPTVQDLNHQDVVLVLQPLYVFAEHTFGMLAVIARYALAGKLVHSTDHSVGLTNGLLIKLFHKR